MDSWREREIQKHYPDAKTIMDLSNVQDLNTACFDGCAFVSPDVIFAQKIPSNRLSFLLKCKGMMHDKSILFIQVLQSDLNYVVKEAEMKLIKIFKEGLYFIYVMKK
jgi:hypothetical protein